MSPSRRPAWSNASRVSSSASASSPSTREPSCRCRRALQELLLDPPGRPPDLEIERHLRRGLMAARLKALHDLGARAMALEQRRAQRREQGGFAHLVRPDDQVQAVRQPPDPDRPVELAELIELERAQLHEASF
jgi:hypothetical protein